MLKIKDDVYLNKLKDFGFEFKQSYDNLIIFEYHHQGKLINPTIRIDGVTREVYFSSDPKEKYDLNAEEITNEVLKNLKKNKMVEENVKN